MLKILVSFGLYVMIIANSVADGAVVVRAIDGNFEDIRDRVAFAVESQGLVVDHTAKVGDMLARTGKDLGETRQIFGKAEIIEPHTEGWEHGMSIFRYHEWMTDLGMDASTPFERQVCKIVPYKMLYTETWLWKQGYHAKQRWLA